MIDFLKWLTSLIGQLVMLLPRRIQLGLGAILGLLWFDVFRIRRRVALENLAIAFPELGKYHRVKLARESVVNIGQTIVEELVIMRLKAEHLDKYVSFKGVEHLDQALQMKRGVLLMTLHLGNADLGSAAMALKGYRFHVISKQFKARWLNEIWFGARRATGTEFISAEKSSYEILRALKKNECVAFVLDQFMGPPIGARTRFFGKDTGTAMGLAVFAQKTKAPVLPCYSYRRHDGRLQLVFEAPIDTQHLDFDRKNIAIMTQVYTDKIEDIIRKHPGQWMWIHRRWKEFG